MALVLARKEGERIFIADNIEIVVLEIRGSTVRLGVIANQDIRIEREEKREAA